MVLFARIRQFCTFANAATVAALIASASTVHAQAAFAVLHSFGSPPSDGRVPKGGLVQGPDGTLYGMTNAGGAFGGGTVFSEAADGSGYTILHDFTGSDGVAPHGSLIQGADGTLYGTTSGGENAFEPNGASTIFSLASDGTNFTILYTFGGGGDGKLPLAGLVQGPDGTLYGTTYRGGVTNLGTIFSISPDGRDYTLLHSFRGLTFGGANPRAGLIQGPDGTLYGTTVNGGFGGIVYRISPDGTGFGLLHFFIGVPDGMSPWGGVIQGADGTLFGTTHFGGSSLGMGAGAVYRLAPDGSDFAIVYSFDGSEAGGDYPRAGLVQDAAGTLYGTTLKGGAFPDLVGRGGTVFRVEPDGTGFALLHSFKETDGYEPAADLIQGFDGSLYGTTTGGVIAGVIFRVGTVPLFAPSSASATLGEKARLQTPD